MKYLFSLLLFCAFSAAAQDTASWLRYPAISPDGQQIVFCYKGNIFKVNASGGEAVPLTVSSAYDFSPVISNDGKWIAFASDRYGKFDVFVMPFSGGEARRLTYYSGQDIPVSFSPDNQQVLFTSERQKLVTDVQFPDAGFSELYAVNISGGEAKQLLPVPAINATYSHAGDKIIYHDLKGYENEWRKHHTSSVTRDIWVYDFKAKKYSLLTTNPGEDRNPVFASDDDHFYYLSEQSGVSFNVYESSLSQPAKQVAITSFTKKPVRFLTRANNNTLCFGYNGDVYIKKDGSVPQKVQITIAADGLNAIEKTVSVNSGITEMKLSPNGKELAYIFRGEVFVSSVEGGVTKRITNTASQERSVSFSADGRSLVYAAERSNNWNVYTTSIVRKEEPYFYASTLLKEETAIATKEEEFQPAFSPDGKEVAYLENRVVLKVVNLATKQSRTIVAASNNYSYADGDQYYQWSPDGKWFLVQFGYIRMFTPQIGLVASDGKSPMVNITQSGYNCYSPKWMMGGKMMIYGFDRNGDHVQAGYTSTFDIFGMFFTRDAFDRFKLSKEEYALVKEIEDKQKDSATTKTPEKKKGKNEKPAAKDSAAKKDLQIEWDNLSERKARLTISAASISDMTLSKDGDKLFYLAKYEKGYDLWTTDLRTKDTKLFVKLGAQNAAMELSADGKALFILAEGRITKIDPESGKQDGVSLAGEMLLNQYEEKAYMFDHMWRQMKEKFLFVDLTADWDYYYANYRQFLPFINNNYDYAEMVSEMLGELNVSHTGCYGFGGMPGGDKTASLGIFYDYNFEGKGLKVLEVLEGGPLDKAGIKLKAGCIIEKIDGDSITPNVDHYKLLNRKEGKYTLLSVYDPSSGKRWDETIKPINGGENAELLYKRWVKARRAEVDSISKGKVGYVHVRGMNDDSYRTVIDEVLGKAIDKESVIVDTRFNGGGNLHEQLSDFLTGKKYFDIIPHGQNIGYEPYDKWIKPSIVLMGECNYSDAHLFPVAYKLKNIGKTVGMPVPGTGTFVWWENQIDPAIVFGIPQGGWQMPDGKFCENTQLEPDIKVRNEPSVSTLGKDEQIAAAIKELMKK